MGIFDNSKKGLAKTAQLLKTDVRDLFKAQGRLVDQDFLDELFATLVKTDMGVDASQELVDEIGKVFRARVVQMEEILGRIRQKLKEILG